MVKKMPFEEFQKIYNKVPRICIDLLIENKKGVLLSKRVIPPWKNLWHFPGGGVLFGESLYECARRIAREELGIEIEIQRFLGILEYPLETVDGDKRHSISLILHVSPISEDFILNGETLEVRFFENEIPEAIIPVVGDFLKKAKFVE